MKDLGWTVSAERWKAKGLGRTPPARPRARWRRRRAIAGVMLLGAVPFLPGVALAQEVPPETPATAPQEALRVFLDCKTRCDQTFFRTEITFVSWVRDRFDSQVHVIVTDQDTGGGGREYIFEFLGQERVAGRVEELRFVSDRTDTDDEVRTGMARVLAVGLANYSAMLGRIEGFEIRSAESFRQGDVIEAPTLIDDPWNLWVFNVRGSGAVAGEETEDNWSVNGSLSANRTTETWKVRFSSSGYYSHTRQELSDSSIFTTIFRSWNLFGGAAYALAEHWSVGATGRLSSESRQNLRRGGTLGTGVEFSFYPYIEATRRQALIFYQVGIVDNVYEEETIFGETSETRPAHELTLSLDYEQPWGEAGLTLQSLQYLHDLSLYEVTASGDLDFRVARGLSVNIRGSGAIVENQIYLPKGDLTDEEILTGQFERGTRWRYRVSVGFRYAFGSIYNNVVNNRYDRGL